MSKEAFDFDSIFKEGMEYSVGEDLDNLPENTEKEPEVKKEKEKEGSEEELQYVVGEFPEGDEGKDDEGNEKEVSDEDKNDPLSESTKDASGSFALAFAKFQQERGFISDIDEEELQEVLSKDGEIGLLDFLLDKQRDSIYEEAKSTYSGDKQELLEYFELKDAGVDADLAKELAFQKGQFETLKEEDLEDNEELRKNILIQHYKLTTNFNDKRIKEKIEDSVSLGKDIAEASEALVELKELNKKQIENAKEQVKLQDAAKLKAMGEYKEGLKKSIYETSEIIEGQKINKTIQQKMEKLLLEPVKDDKGNVMYGLWAERAKDPQKFDVQLVGLLATGAFWGKMEGVKKSTRTKVVNEFEEMLKNNKGAGVKGKNPSVKEGDEFSVTDFLKGRT